MSKSKILITGVTGFIGSHLALKLSKDENIDVHGVAKYAVSRDDIGLKPFMQNINFHECNIEDYHAVHNMIKKINPDLIIHLAALSPVKDSFQNPISYVNVNVIGTVNIAHAMLELPDYKDKKLIYASTAEVFGFQEIQPMHENLLLKPSSPYANTKAMTDMYLKMMTQVYDLNTTILRCTNTYGRKLDGNFYIEYLINSMLKDEIVYIGAPDSIRDYMYVDDHVNAYLKAIQHKEIKGEAFNAGLGIGVSNKDLAYKIADQIGFDKNKIKLNQYPDGYPNRPITSDQPFIVLDPTKIKERMGWEPKYSIDEGLKKTIEYWREFTIKTNNE